MAEETQGVSEGAAGGAPTAPHATAGGGRRTGPEKFWDTRRVRRALAVALVVSVGLHVGFGPWSVFPEQGFEVVEVEGDPSIPIDLIDETTAMEERRRGEPPPEVGAGGDGSPSAGAGAARAGAPRT